MASIALIKPISYFFVFLILCQSLIAGGNDSTANYRLRKIVFIGSTSAFAAGSIFYLNRAWYLDYKSGGFHVFNDNKEWLQMDKAGHFWTNYNSGSIMMEAAEWAGIKKKNALWFGLSGTAYMTAIEFMDGFSSGWGFSYGDMIANVLGGGFSIGQKALWDEQHILIKYSFHNSGLSYYNPRLLGKNFPERLLKDYNSQIYWISYSPFNHFKDMKTNLRWLCVSFGMGATGMLSAETNYVNYSVDGTPNVTYYYETKRMREFYLSLDVDLTKLKPKSKFLKAACHALNILKFPFPAIKFNQQGSGFCWLR